MEVWWGEGEGEGGRVVVVGRTGSRKAKFPEKHCVASIATGALYLWSVRYKVRIRTFVSILLILISEFVSSAHSCARGTSCAASAFDASRTIC